VKSEWEEAHRIVRRWGWNATAYQILNPGFTYWIDGEHDAVVGYIERHRVRVVAGAPVSSDEAFPAVIDAFEADAARAGYGVIYFCAEQRIADVAAAHPGRLTFPIGAQPFWRPETLVCDFQRHASLRAQLNRARNKGVCARRIYTLDDDTLRALQRCLDEWIEQRGLPPLHFLIETDTLQHLEDRHLFVAERDGGAVAFLVATPIPARDGWLVEQIVRGTRAPNGTAELLLYHAAKELAAEGWALLTLGLAPLAHRAQPSVDQTPPWLRGVLSALRAYGKRFYNFEGLENFKSKFPGAQWAPVYASMAPGTKALPAMLAVTAAFSGEPIRRFVPHTLQRVFRRPLRQVHASPGR
jgi:phosphatidylglycerol lysyltransferase